MWRELKLSYVYVNAIIRAFPKEATCYVEQHWLGKRKFIVVIEEKQCQSLSAGVAGETLSCFVLIFFRNNVQICKLI